MNMRKVFSAMASRPSGFPAAPLGLRLRRDY
jgi:hypothetical protein